MGTLEGGMLRGSGLDHSGGIWCACLGRPAKFHASRGCGFAARARTRVWSVGATFNANGRRDFDSQVRHARIHFRADSSYAQRRSSSNAQPRSGSNA